MSLGSHETQSLAPDNYGDISLGPNATLTMTAGTYTASSLSTKPNSLLVVDDTNGPVVLYLRGSVAHQGAITGKNGVPAFLVTATRVDVSGAWSGTLLSPGGVVNIGPPPNAQHQGAVFGGQVQLQATLTQHAFPWALVRAARSACALTPKVVCVKNLGGGSYLARFGYDNAVRFEGTAVPIGFGNYFTPGSPNRGQPNFFVPGQLIATTNAGTFDVPFDGTNLTWALGGQSVSANSNTAACQ